MNGLLIANKDQVAREQMAAVFQQDDCRVETADSVINALQGILDKSIQVVVLGGVFDEFQIAKFVPLLKKCNRNLSIILVSDEIPLDLLRRIRKEGIFYHALKPVEGESWDEIRQVVRCAFDNYRARQNAGRKLFRKDISVPDPADGLASLG
jgi:DNA-binding NtrC family response regulator